MNRRNFIRAGLSALIGAAVLPKIPLAFSAKPLTATGAQIAWVNAGYRVLVARQIRDNFFRESPLLAYLKKAGMIQINGGGEGFRIPYYFYEKK